MPWQFDIYTLTGMLWVIGIYLAPYVMMIVAAAMRSMDPSLEEAAQVSGLNRSADGAAHHPAACRARDPVGCGAGLHHHDRPVRHARRDRVGAPAPISHLAHLIGLAGSAAAFGVMAVLALYLILLSLLAMLQRWLLKGRSSLPFPARAFARGRPPRAGLDASPPVSLLYCFLTIIAPLLVLLAAAFSTFTWSGRFTLANLSIVDFAGRWRTLRNSLLISIVSATLGP